MLTVGTEPSAGAMLPEIPCERRRGRAIARPPPSGKTRLASAVQGPRAPVRRGLDELHQLARVAVAGVGGFLDLFQPGERLSRVALADEDLDAQPEVVKCPAQVVPEAATFVRWVHGDYVNV